jgi:hypothetical protein
MNVTALQAGQKNSHAEPLSRKEEIDSDTDSDTD